MIDIAVRDRDAEDDQALGFAGFIHMNHRRWKNWAPLSFGLGIGEESKLSFFLGTSWELYDKAYLTGGWNWASVDRLPSGQQLNQPLTDPNALSNLDSRIDSDFFIAVSYTFLGDRAPFKKPFAPLEVRGAWLLSIQANSNYRNWPNSACHQIQISMI